MLTDALNKSERFIVVADREMQGKAMETQNEVNGGRFQNGKKTAQKGHMTPAQLLVRGKVLGKQDGTSRTGVDIPHDRMPLHFNTETNEISFYVEIMDAQTGMLIATQQVTGKSRNFSLGGALGGLFGTSGPALRTEKKDNFSKACADAMQQIVTLLLAKVPDVQWLGTLIKCDAAEDEYILNRGEREGVRVGMVFQVGEGEALTDPDDGSVLEWTLQRTGVLEVVKVHPRTAYCKLLKQDGKITEGMVVTPLSDADTFGQADN
jgi:hypothetical protein